MHRSNARPAFIAVVLVLQACSGASSGAGVTPPLTAGAATFVSAVSLSALPLDDKRYTAAGPKTGWVYSCQSTFTGGGSSVDGPWIDRSARTWNALEKIAVQGSHHWTSQLTTHVSGTNRTWSGNGLPSHATGTFPIASSDPAFQYDRNPNSIESQSVSGTVPAVPKVASKPSCLGGGPIGIMLTGAQLFDALDALGRDAPAHELLDSCNGHPQEQGVYHYHALSACMSDPGTAHSRLLGYANDGFGIYGIRGVKGAVVTDADLDACHGHTHAIPWNGKSVVMYHYHFTYEYPYTLGCYKGTPMSSGAPGGA